MGLPHSWRHKAALWHNAHTKNHNYLIKMTVLALLNQGRHIVCDRLQGYHGFLKDGWINEIINKVLTFVYQLFVSLIK